MKRVLLLLLLLLLLLPLNAFAATNYFISAAGNDSTGTGSFAAPYQTITKANTLTLAPGDTVAFRAGDTFSGTTALTLSQSGTLGNPITFTTYGVGRATLVNTSGKGFVAAGRAYFTISNLKFSGADHTVNTAHGIHITMNNSASAAANITLQDMEVMQFGRRGMYLQADSNNAVAFTNLTLLRVTVHDNHWDGAILEATDFPRAVGRPYANTTVYVGYSSFYNNFGFDHTSTGDGYTNVNGNGVLINDTDGVTIEYTTAYNNGGGGGTVGSIGIWFNSTTNGVIQFCEAHHNHTGASTDGGGFDLDGGTQFSTLQYNYSHDNDGAGFLMSGYDNQPWGHNVVRFNVSQNDGRKNSYAAVVLFSGGTQINTVDFYQNTIYNDSLNIVNGAPSAVKQHNAGSVGAGVTFRNNIFQSAGTTAVLLTILDGTPTFQGNDYWPSGGTFSITWNGTTYGSLAAWRTATSQEKNGASSTGLQVDPAMANPGAGGTIGNAINLRALNAYKLLGSSALIGAGLNLSGLFSTQTGNLDFYQATYPTVTASVGAAEYALTPPVPPAAMNMTVATPNAPLGTATTIAQLRTFMSSSGQGGTGPAGTAGCNDIILIDHTQPSFTAQTGGETLPVINGGIPCPKDQYLTIASDDYASLPAVVRIQSCTAHSPTMIIPADAFGFFVAQVGTHHIRLLGLNIKAQSGAVGASCSTASCGLLYLQSPSPNGTDVHHIIVDRTCLAGDPSTGVIQGIQAAGANIAAINSKILNVWNNPATCPSSCGETHGMLIATGTGPYFIDNTEISGGDISILVGDTGVNLAGIIPCDGSITRSYFHSDLMPSGVRLQHKNLHEIKHGCRWKMDGNRYDTSYQGNQAVCIQLVSYRGSQSLASDIQFTNNWVNNCPAGVDTTFRPLEVVHIGPTPTECGGTCGTNADLTLCAGGPCVRGDGTTNCSGGPCVKIFLNGACDCTSGDGVAISGVNGTTEANKTILPITKTDSRSFTIPVAFTNPFTTSQPFATAFMIFQATPLQRVKICNTLFTDITKQVGNFPLIAWNPNPQITLIGGTDGSLSTTGDWKSSDINVCHNTFTNPTNTENVKQFLFLDDTLITPDWLFERLAIRDNLIHVSSGGSSTYTVSYNAEGAGGPAIAYGTTALNNMSNSVSRDFSHNVGYQSSLGDELNKFTSPDSWISDSQSSCATLALLVSCTTNTIAANAINYTAWPSYQTAASDGAQIGINAVTLAAAQCGTLTGDWTACGGGGGGGGPTLNLGGTLKLGTGTLRIGP